ncbi:uncharacterized protein LOC134742928 [Cydia strobilella]|uniref:uncharacterized protein LOC134742928 n=1 Tax=Cydia strobilella TaxID=1100964 RepID=UPI0030058D1F
MNQNISDAEISSCHEIEETRREAERVALEALRRRVNDIIRLAIEEDDGIVGERDVLALELENELRSESRYSELLNEAQQASRDQLQVMLELQTQLTNANVDTVHLLTSLQELRERNHATLRADPIYALVQEEREMQQKLDDMGIYVYPPTGSQFCQ